MYLTITTSTLCKITFKTKIYMIQGRDWYSNSIYNPSQRAKVFVTLRLWLLHTLTPLNAPLLSIVNVYINESCPIKYTSLSVRLYVKGPLIICQKTIKHIRRIGYGCMWCCQMTCCDSMYWETFGCTNLCTCI